MSMPEVKRREPIEDGLHEHVRYALATWPQIDPAVEGIVARIAKAERYLVASFRRSLASAGLTQQDFGVLMALHRRSCSHGALCRELTVSTGAMTNRLDKLEQAGLVVRTPDPNDRRGVLLELTDQGRAALDQYMDAASTREKALLAGLGSREKQRLNELLQKLLVSIETELD
jgi:DNA-binding MarR family transcriptional regulator